MGALGAPTPKPTALYSSHKYVKMLQRTFTPEQLALLDPDVEINVRDEMTGKVTGGEDSKSSQAHPVDYGLAVQEALSRHGIETLDTDSEASVSTIDEQLCTLDLWPDAGMMELCQWLGVPHDSLID